MFTKRLNTIASTLFITLCGVGVLSGESIQHTFLDGTTLKYSVLEKTAPDTSSTVNQVSFTLPYLGTLKLNGKADLKTNAPDSDYTVIISPQIDPSAVLEYVNLPTGAFYLKPSPKGILEIQLSNLGERVKGSNVVIESSYSQATIEQIEESHEFTKVAGSDELFLNKGYQILKKLTSKGFTEEYSPNVLRVGFDNPYGKLAEVRTDYSYVSGKDPFDYQKDFAGTLSLKGEKEFVLNADLHAGIPFSKPSGAEKLEGFTFNLSVPVIDLRLENDAEKKQLRDTLQNNIKVYESVLEKYSNPITASLLDSIRKNSEEIINRHMKYFEDLTKEDINFFKTSFKGAQSSETSATMAELDIESKDFALKLEFINPVGQAVKLVLTMPKPQTTTKKISSNLRLGAWIFEPVIRDMGYWDAIQNVSDADKLLGLIRQLSDDPAATGDAPLTITIEQDENGWKIGTLTQEKAYQIILGWFLMSLPLNR